MSDPVQIPANAVRVWRGFRAPATSLESFYTLLGTVFVPATVQMQIQIGLDAYLPTVPAGLPDKPATVPDETAILFWDSQPTYLDGFNTLAVRTYTLTHGGVYDTTISGAQFPSLFAGELVKDQPCYLFDRPADWMHGTVRQWLIGRPPSIGWPPTVSPQDFRSTYAAALAKLQSAAAVEGAIACAGDEYFVFWALGDAADAAVAELAAAGPTGGPTRSRRPRPRSQPACGTPGQGCQSTSERRFNMQFKRRWET